MEVRRLSEMKESFNLNVLVYGPPGSGKTTFGVKSEGVLLADVENGSGLLSMSGLDADVAKITKWDDMREVYDLASGGKYKTVVIDPLGELLEKLITNLKLSGYATAKGDGLSLQGWGVAKDKFKDMVRAFRDLKVDLCLVAHVIEKQDEDHLYARPKLQANLDGDVCAMMDVVGYLQPVIVDKKRYRRCHFQGTDRFYAKDRSGVLGEFIDDTSMGQVLEKIRGASTISIGLKRDKDDEKFMNELEKGKKS